MPLDYIGDRSSSHCTKMVEAKATLRMAQGLLRTAEGVRKQVLSSELTEQAGTPEGNQTYKRKKIKIRATTIADICYALALS